MEEGLPGGEATVEEGLSWGTATGVEDALGSQLQLHKVIFNFKSYGIQVYFRY